MHVIMTSQPGTFSTTSSAWANPMPNGALDRSSSGTTRGIAETGVHDDLSLAIDWLPMPGGVFSTMPATLAGTIPATPIVLRFHTPSIAVPRIRPGGQNGNRQFPDARRPTESPSDYMTRFSGPPPGHPSDPHLQRPVGCSAGDPSDYSLLVDNSTAMAETSLATLQANYQAAQMGPRLVAGREAGGYPMANAPPSIPTTLSSATTSCPQTSATSGVVFGSSIEHSAGSYNTTLRTSTAHLPTLPGSARSQEFPPQHGPTVSSSLDSCFGQLDYTRLAPDPTFSRHAHDIRGRFGYGAFPELPSTAKQSVKSCNSHSASLNFPIERPPAFSWHGHSIRGRFGNGYSTKQCGVEVPLSRLRVRVFNSRGT
ncbi:hypothetical protein VTJ04DRAFT_4569 [Mycothermus thermophilus]|uniref:uncharacterized protein n=1 Tax=Humicola insolens TaxID=85995 RepID=UPI00374385F9